MGDRAERSVSRLETPGNRSPKKYSLVLVGGPSPDRIGHMGHGGAERLATVFERRPAKKKCLQVLARLLRLFAGGASTRTGRLGS